MDQGKNANLSLRKKHYLDYLIIVLFNRTNAQQHLNELILTLRNGWMREYSNTKCLIVRRETFIAKKTRKWAQNHRMCDFRRITTETELES